MSAKEFRLEGGMGKGTTVTVAGEEGGRLTLLGLSHCASSVFLFIK